MALGAIVRRTWGRLFGGWWDGVPEPPRAKIRELVGTYFARVVRGDRRVPLPPEWAEEFACEVWKHGFASGVLHEEAEFDRRAAGFDPDQFAEAETDDG